MVRAADRSAPRRTTRHDIQMREPIGMTAAAAFVMCFGLYLVFAGQASGTEIAAGLPAAGLVAAFAWLQHRGQAPRIGLRGPWHRIVLAASAALAKDSVRVAGVLLRAIVSPKGTVAGTIGRQPFHPGSGRAADAGRRGLVTLAGSFAPNGFVLDIPPSVILGEADILLMHRLAPSPPEPDPEWPL